MTNGYWGTPLRQFCALALFTSAVLVAIAFKHGATIDALANDPMSIIEFILNKG